ncbi:MAG: hypothetical protein WD669_08405 [Pirellulales bacterium]
MKRISQHRLADWFTRIGCGRLATCLALVGVGLLAGAAMPPGAARGDVKDATPAQSFQTGSQLSVPVLKEIAATLRQMDARLSRMETIAQQMRNSKMNQAPVK